MWRNSKEENTKKNKNLVSITILVIFFLVINIFISLSFIPNVKATNVSGHIKSDTTWNISGNPYIVTGTLYVDKGVTLTIEPGVIIRFNGMYYWYIDGTLNAKGNETNKIIITSNKANPAVSDWREIWVRKNGCVYIDNCEISYASYGIEIEQATDCFIANTSISNCFHGISLRGSSYCTVSNIQFWNITSKAFQVSSEYSFLRKFYNHSVQDCMVNGKPLIYYFNLNDITIEDLDLGGILLAWCNNITSNNCSVIGGSGIIYMYTTNSTIANCTITDSYNGILLAHIPSEDWIKNPENLPITMNTIVEQNLIRNNKYGIRYGGDFNILRCNDIISNEYGMFLGSAYNNKIYHNNFIDNDDQVHQNGYYNSNEGENFWDTGKEGNYWSGYSGGDIEGDGIGDIPKYVHSDHYNPTSVYDNYPLMQPFNGSIPPDTKSPYFTKYPLIPERNVTLPNGNLQLEFTTSERGFYEVIIDTDGVQGFDNASDITLKGNTSAVFQEIFWDGKYSNGNYVEEGDYHIQVTIWDLAGNQIDESYNLGSVTIVFDSDEDGVKDIEDAYPNDPTQWEDRDGDSWGDNRWGNNPDAFPDDPNEWLDTDSDNIGNNADLDDDNDKIPDEWEEKYGLNSTDPQDADEDNDGDGYNNLEEYQAGTNPKDANSKPLSLTDYFYYILFVVLFIPILITSLIMKRLFSKSHLEEEEKSIEEESFEEEEGIEKEGQTEDLLGDNVPKKEETPEEPSITQTVKDKPPIIPDTKIFCSNCRYPIILHESEFLPIECPMCKTMVKPPKRLD
jgi:parallel beta-helix repeat protein